MSVFTSDAVLHLHFGLLLLFRSVCGGLRLQIVGSSSRTLSFPPLSWAINPFSTTFGELIITKNKYICKSISEVFCNFQKNRSVFSTNGVLVCQKNLHFRKKIFKPFQYFLFLPFAPVFAFLCQILSPLLPPSAGSYHRKNPPPQDHQFYGQTLPNTSRTHRKKDRRTRGCGGYFAQIYSK